MKTIIITGAANGLGKECVKLLAKEGENTLILIDIDRKNLEKVANKYKCDFYVCDVSCVESVEETFKQINKHTKTIDCLINCAGLWSAGDVSKFIEPVYKNMNQLERMQKVVNTNMFGIMAMTTKVFPYMKKQGYGQIININSASGLYLEPPFPVYNATKTGATQFRKAIQTDMANHNIRVTDIHPGLMDIEFFKHAKNPLPENVMQTGLNPAEVANTVKYVLELPEGVTIPSLEIWSMKNI